MFSCEIIYLFIICWDFYTIGYVKIDSTTDYDYENLDDDDDISDFIDEMTENLKLISQYEDKGKRIREENQLIIDEILKNVMEGIAQATKLSNIYDQVHAPHQAQMMEPAELIPKPIFLWSRWSSCSVSCGLGTRTRQCFNESSLHCSEIREPCRMVSCNGEGASYAFLIIIGTVTSTFCVFSVLGWRIYTSKTKMRKREITERILNAHDLRPNAPRPTDLLSTTPLRGDEPTTDEAIRSRKLTAFKRSVSPSESSGEEAAKYARTDSKIVDRLSSPSAPDISIHEIPGTSVAPKELIALRSSAIIHPSASTSSSSSTQVIQSKSDYLTPTTAYANVADMYAPYENVFAPDPKRFSQLERRDAGVSESGRFFTDEGKPRPESYPHVMTSSSQIENKLVTSSSQEGEEIEGKNVNASKTQSRFGSRFKKSQPKIDSTPRKAETPYLDNIRQIESRKKSLINLDRDLSKSESKGRVDKKSSSRKKGTMKSESPAKFSDESTPDILESETSIKKHTDKKTKSRTRPDESKEKIKSQTKDTPEIFTLMQIRDSERRLGYRTPEEYVHSKQDTKPTEDYTKLKSDAKQLDDDKPVQNYDDVKRSSIMKTDTRSKQDYYAKLKEVDGHDEDAHAYSKLKKGYRTTPEEYAKSKQDTKPTEDYAKLKSDAKQSKDHITPRRDHSTPKDYYSTRDYSRQKQDYSTKPCKEYSRSKQDYSTKPCKEYSRSKQDYSTKPCKEYSRSKQDFSERQMEELETKGVKSFSREIMSGSKQKKKRPSSHQRAKLASDEYVSSEEVRKAKRKSLKHDRSRSEEVLDEYSSEECREDEDDRRLMECKEDEDDRRLMECRKRKSEKLKSESIVKDLICNRRPRQSYVTKGPQGIPSDKTEESTEDINIMSCACMCQYPGNTCYYNHPNCFLQNCSCIPAQCAYNICQNASTMNESESNTPMIESNIKQNNYNPRFYPRNFGNRPNINSGDHNHNMHCDHKNIMTAKNVDILEKLKSRFDKIQHDIKDTEHIETSNRSCRKNEKISFEVISSRPEDHFQLENEPKICYINLDAGDGVAQKLKEIEELCSFKSPTNICSNNNNNNIEDNDNNHNNTPPNECTDTITDHPIDKVESKEDKSKNDQLEDDSESNCALLETAKAIIDRSTRYKIEYYPMDSPRENVTYVDANIQTDDVSSDEFSDFGRPETINDSRIASTQKQMSGVMPEPGRQELINKLSRQSPVKRTLKRFKTDFNFNKTYASTKHIGNNLLHRILQKENKHKPIATFSQIKSTSKDNDARDDKTTQDDSHPDL